MGMRTTLHPVWCALVATLVLTATTVAAQTKPMVTVTKDVAPNPAVAGQPVIWTLRVLNGGDAPVANVKLTDTLPSGVTAISASSPNFECRIAGLQVACLAAELPIGLTEVSIRGIAPVSEPKADPVVVLKPRAGTITPRGQALPDGILETVASLRLTVGTLEKERHELTEKLAAVEAERNEARGEVTRLGSELDVARSARKDLQATAAATSERIDTLNASIASELKDRTAIAEELASVQAALLAAKTEIDTLRQSVAAKEGTIDQLTEDLATARMQLVMAEPLKFSVDCPAEATSQRWLIANLPYLLDAAIANPTQRNTRSFLCAQRTATAHGDFAKEDPRRFEPVSPADTVTDGKLHTHTVFQGPPGAEVLRELRVAAEAGSPQALNDWGVLVLVGEGTPQNLLLGRGYIEAAAKAGSAIAAANLAVMFDRGVGVEPNQAMARQWRRVAAVIHRGDGS